MTRSKSSAPTIYDVARRAGVSVATVSRFINHTVPVSPEAADRLQQAMQELKFVPHATARNLATQKTNTLGLLCTYMHGDFFAPLLNGIESVTSEFGYDLLVSSTHRPQLSTSYPAPLGPHNTDGLMVFAGSLDQSGLAQFYETGLPLVLIHVTPPPGMPIPCVTVENKSASFKIVEHLIQVHGRREIIFLQGPSDHEDSAWRELGYRQALEKHHILLNPAWIQPGEFDRNVACASMQRLLLNGIPFDAVFTGDDDAAVGTLAALGESSMRVPEDVSVVGFDDQRMSPYLTPPLTTVSAPTEEVGRVAAQQLIRLVRDGEADLLTLLPTQIVIRRSCGCTFPLKPNL